MQKVRVVICVPMKHLVVDRGWGVLKGSHSTNATCLTGVFFEGDE